jgi:hypothetical protein
MPTMASKARRPMRSRKMVELTTKRLDMGIRRLKFLPGTYPSISTVTENKLDRHPF